MASGTCAGGTIRDYTFGAAGHLEDVTAGGNVVDFDFDEAGQLEFTERLAADENALFSYDGRGFLRDVLATSVASAAAGAARTARAWTETGGTDGARPASAARSSQAHSSGEASLSPQGGSAIFSDDFESGDGCAWDSATPDVWPSCPTPSERMLTATYSSDGRLHSITESATSDPAWVLYFAGRPVAIARPVDGAPANLTFLTTDHLGTPILAMNASGASIWHGGFEPFGKDYTTPSAESLGIFLRLPGQWDEPIWDEATLGAEVFYNVYRWYGTPPGAYSSSDPLKRRREPAEFQYSRGNPTRWRDPLGLFSIAGDCSASDCTPQLDECNGEPTASCVLRLINGIRRRVGENDACRQALLDVGISNALDRLSSDDPKPLLYCTQGDCGFTETGGHNYARNPFGSSIPICGEMLNYSWESGEETLFHEILHQWFAVEPEDSADFRHVLAACYP